MIGDISTSDVIVRLRTGGGRDDWVYCHSNVLMETSSYFSDLLSGDRSTSQILDSRFSIDLQCEEEEFNSHITVLRLLYTAIDESSTHVFHGVKHALGILQPALSFGCDQIVSSCVNYLSAVPWGESEEEDILRIIPRMGSIAEPILSRLQPVNPECLENLFLAAFEFVVSSPPSPNDSKLHLKASFKDQLDYMVIEDDDDGALIKPNQRIKSRVLNYSMILLERFEESMNMILQEHQNKVQARKIELLCIHLSDLQWVYRMLTIMEVTSRFIEICTNLSDKMLRVLQSTDTEDDEHSNVNFMVLQLCLDILKSVESDRVILSVSSRLNVVRVWISFIRILRPLLAPANGCIWNSMESSCVSILLSLPVGDVDEVLTEWLASEHIDYPDLTQVFDVWCKLSRVALKRFEKASPPRS